MLARPAAVLAFALLCPTLLAWMSETTAGRPVSRAMLLFGMAGALPGFATLWSGLGTMHAAMAVALDPHALALAWAAQAAGWLTAELLPLLARLAAEAAGGRRGRQLRMERERLAAEWSLPEAAAGPDAGAGMASAATPSGSALRAARA